MIWIDYLIFAIFAFTVLSGLWHGLIGEVVACLVWVAAFILAVTYTPGLAVKLTPFITNSTLNHRLAFGIIFIVILMVGSAINFLSNLLLSFIELGVVNRVCGGMLGLFRGGFIISVLLLAVQLADLNTNPVWSRSKVAPYFTDAVVYLAGIVHSHALADSSSGDK